jgi:RNA:NAD 2'-phosphotransferase (TPT1/KptA family)
MGRGGQGGGSRNPANQPREVQVSRKLSWLLRHGAASEKLELGKGGYVNVQEAVCVQAHVSEIAVFKQGGFHKFVLQEFPQHQLLAHN